jgi:hypothetical protein
MYTFEPVCAMTGMLFPHLSIYTPKKKIAVPAKWKIAYIEPCWHNDYLPGGLIYLPAWQIYLPAQLNICHAIIY